MSRPRLGPKPTRRLLMEALEDRRVLTGLALGATALVELTITVPAPAHVAELEQSAKVSVVVDSEAAGAPEASVAKSVHEQLAELRQEYREIRHEMIEESKEARDELRELQQDLRTESGFDAPTDRVELKQTVNEIRVELKHELHEQLVSLRHEFRDARAELRAAVGNNDQNDSADNGRAAVVGKEKTQDATSAVELSGKAEVVERHSQSAEDAAQSLRQVNPVSPDALVSHSDSVVPPDAGRDVLPADATADNHRVPATVRHDGAVVRATATGQELDAIRTAAAASGDLAVGTVGVVEAGEATPVALVIAGMESETDAELQGAGLAAGDSSFIVASLDAALQQFLQEADELARTLTRNSSMVPWLLAALAGGIGLELYRRKKKAGRATLAAAGLTPNSTLSWVPGMPGSFSDEDA